MFPWTLGLSSFLMEEQVLIHVKVNKAIPEIECALLGSIGPYEKDDIALIPIYLIHYFFDEQMITIQIPYWLIQENLIEILNKERESKDLCQCPHPQYVEIGRFLLNGSWNIWSDDSHPHPNSARYRENIARLFESFITLRLKKISKYNFSLLRNGVLVNPYFSNFERKRLGLIGLNYFREIKSIYIPPQENLEDILSAMNVFNAEKHYALQKKVQSIFKYHLQRTSDTEKNI